MITSRAIGTLLVLASGISLGRLAESSPRDGFWWTLVALSTAFAFFGAHLIQPIRLIKSPTKEVA